MRNFREYKRYDVPACAKGRAILACKFCIRTEEFSGLFVITVFLLTINSEFELLNEEHNRALFVCQLPVAFFNIYETSVMIKAW